jgi:hypothetical protein
MIKQNCRVIRLALLLTLACGSSVFAQTDQNKDKPASNLKISGYLQTQFQNFFVPDSAGLTNGSFSTFAGGTFCSRYSTQRFMIRRGRVKLAYSAGLTESVFSFDITEKGLSVKDLNITVKEKFMEIASLQAGIFNRPFGYEIGYSSSKRESPERSRIIQTLFPGERDLGVALNVAFSSPGRKNKIAFTAALITGNGVSVETDNYLDMVNRICYSDKTESGNIEWHAGLSFYSGYTCHVYSPVDTNSSNQSTKYYIYRYGVLDSQTGAEGFYRDSAESKACGTTGGRVERRYWGVDGQISFKTKLGKTTVRAEYIAGVQPSFYYGNSPDKDYQIYNSMNSMSFSGPSTVLYFPSSSQPYNPVSTSITARNHSTFVRTFRGGYVYLIQDIGNSNHQIVFKYDLYDPNTEVSGSAIDTAWYYGDTLTGGKTYMSPADVQYSTLGIGWNWKVSDQVKFSVYYDMVRNEKTSLPEYAGDLTLNRLPSPGFDADIRDDVLTIRLQYCF